MKTPEVKSTETKKTKRCSKRLYEESLKELLCAIEQLGLVGFEINQTDIKTIN